MIHWARDLLQKHSHIYRLYPYDNLIILVDDGRWIGVSFNIILPVLKGVIPTSWSLGAKKTTSITPPQEAFQRCIFKCYVYHGATTPNRGNNWLLLFSTTILWIAFNGFRSGSNTTLDLHVEHNVYDNNMFKYQSSNTTSDLQLGSIYIYIG